MNPKLGHQFTRFFLGGLATVGLDWSTYFFLNNFLKFDSLISKGLSFLTGAIFAFFFNGIVSFNSKPSTPRFIRHILLYIFSLTVNITVFRFGMSLTSTYFFFTTFLCLIFATSISMLLNFTGMRYWVFRAEGEIN